MALLRQLPLLLLAACGISGDAGGGADHLPTSGGGPYSKPDPDSDTPAEEPYVIIDDAADLADPAALADPEGGFDLWFSRGGADVWHAHLPSTTHKPDRGPELALAGATAPSVVDAGDGRLLMYFQDATGIGRAVSADRGATWTREESLVVPGGIAPSALVVDDHTYLYYAHPDGSGIALAEADGDGPFATTVDPVLAPSRTISGVFDPDAVGGRTSAGQLHIGLFYAGTAGAATSIYYSASADGHTFMPFLDGKAVLDPGDPDERGPAAVLFPDRGVLFYSQPRTARTVIAVASSPG